MTVDFREGYRCCAHTGRSLAFDQGAYGPLFPTLLGAEKRGAESVLRGAYGREFGGVSAPKIDLR